MILTDLLHFAARAITEARARTVLILIAMAIGVGAVLLLTALGDGARRYVTDEFASLGTNLIIVLPGKTETQGGAPPMTSETPRPLTLDDAMALLRSPQVRRIAPIVIGAAEASQGPLKRQVVVMGSNADLAPIRNFEVAQGSFLPVMDLDRTAPVCVIGETIRRELFRGGRAVGEWLRLGERRFRVVGVLKQTGVSIGVSTDELVIIPVASALQIFNTESLFRIAVEARDRATIGRATQTITDIIRERHEGEEDVTVITQDAVLGTFDRILSALTYTVAGIAAISLLVAGILIMNVMLVAVTQRTTEIGLLKAVGASSGQVLAMFLTEAIMLSLIGALAGLGLGELISLAVRQLYPVLPFYAPGWAVGAGIGTALTTGIVFGVAPARRAARLDPIRSLARR